MRAHIVASVFMATLVAAPLAAQDLEFPAGFDEPMPMHHDGRGLGEFHREITTTSSEAQRFFDQGIQLMTPSIRTSQLAHSVRPGSSILVVPCATSAKHGHGALT